MRNVIFQNWLTIVIIVAFLIFIVYLVYMKRWGELRGIAYRLILAAEKQITGTKMGQERFKTVFRQVYNLIPPWLQFFFPESIVREQLQAWYVEIKDYMDNGTMDGSAKPPDVPIT